MKKIIITGHSLGAALATLASLDLQYDYDVVSYTFASPRVCDGFPTEGMRGFFRIDNTCDIIQQLPLAVMLNFNNPKSPYYYQHSGDSMFFTDNKKGMGANHLIDVFIGAVYKHELKQGIPVR